MLAAIGIPGHELSALIARFASQPDYSADGRQAGTAADANSDPVTGRFGEIGEKP